MQCRRDDGSCVCSEGIAGKNCDICARGYTGNAPFCDPCGECFDNWDDILQELKGIFNFVLISFIMCLFYLVLIIVLNFLYVMLFD